jgi:hypothetical protein
VKLTTADITNGIVLLAYNRGQPAVRRSAQKSRKKLRSRGSKRTSQANSVDNLSGEGAERVSEPAGVECLVSNQRETRDGTEQTRQECDRQISPARPDKSRVQGQGGTLREAADARVPGGLIYPRQHNTVSPSNPPQRSPVSQSLEAAKIVSTHCTAQYRTRSTAFLSRPPGVQASESVSTYSHVAQRYE